jgi:hypothetical protein
MELKMGKELNSALEVVANIVETQPDNQVVKLDELTLTYIGGGEFVSPL